MQRISEVFRALADQTRLRIVHLFLHTTTPLCVCEIVDALQLPQYQVSRHLAVLKNASLVSVRRRGTWAYYALTQDEALTRELWSLMAKFMQDPRLSQDAANLDLRLALRAHGECVIGFVAQDELNRITAQPDANV